MTDADHAGRTRLAGKLVGNRFDRMEWAGAFGDLGTFIPFVVGYLGVMKLDRVTSARGKQIDSFLS